MTPPTAATTLLDPTDQAPIDAIVDLRVERLGAVEDLDRVRDEWDDFVERCGSDIYFTVDWLQAWWTHYGTRRTFEGLLVRDGDRIVGALPFCVQRMWAGPVPVRLARFVGADSTIAVFMPAIAEGHEEAVLGAAFDCLLGDAGCDAVSLSPLSGESPVAAAAEQLAADRFALARSDSTGPHTMFRLPASFETYLANINSLARRDHRRSLRQLNADHELEFRTVSGDEAVGYLDRFVDLHTAQWKAEGRLGHFGDWPGSVDFHRDLMARMATTDRARFYEIVRDGQVLAIEQCFVLGDRCFWRLPGRDPDPELRRMGLGRTSAAELFRVIIGDGQTIVEAGPGHYEYKVRLGCEELPLRRIVISGRSRSARWRSALLLRWSDLLHLVYYRGWFLKLAPRLKLKRRPLWRLWIRSRV
jgi:CelD/BcsL family acetyltransferase involved in cellulose biosynthesis